MECEHIRGLLWEAAGDEENRTAIERHIAECASCRAEYETVRELQAALRAPVAEDVESVRERVLSAVYESSKVIPMKKPRRSFIRWLAPFGAVAAAVLIIISAWPTPTSAISLDDLLGEHVCCLKDSGHFRATCATHMEFAGKVAKELGLSPVAMRSRDTRFIKGDVCKLKGVTAAHGMFASQGAIVSTFGMEDPEGNLLQHPGVWHISGGVWGATINGHEVLIQKQGQRRYQVFMAALSRDQLLAFIDGSAQTQTPRFFRPDPSRITPVSSVTSTR